MRQQLPLLLLQIAYAFLFDAAFGLLRHRPWQASLGPLPITPSTNLFMQFPVGNLYLSLIALSVALGSRHLLRRRSGAHIFNSDCHGKITPVALVNLLVPLFDQVGRIAARTPRVISWVVDPRGNLAHVALWIPLTVWGVRAKVIAPEIHALYDTPLTARGPDGAITCESSPLFCRPFSFPAEARTWSVRWRGDH